MYKHSVGDKVVWHPHIYGDRYVGEVIQVGDGTILVEYYCPGSDRMRTHDCDHPPGWVLLEAANPLEVL